MYLNINLNLKTILPPLSCSLFLPHNLFSSHFPFNQYLLLNEVCCSLVNKNTAPGQKDWDVEESVWKRIQNLSKAISTDDPQFLLKVCVSGEPLLVMSN